MSVEKLYIKLFSYINFKQVVREADRELKHKEAMLGIYGGTALLVFVMFLRLFY